MGLFPARMVYLRGRAEEFAPNRGADINSELVANRGYGSSRQECDLTIDHNELELVDVE